MLLLQQFGGALIPTRKVALFCSINKKFTENLSYWLDSDYSSWLVTPLSGIAAAVCSSTLTNPLDVAKTRLQVTIQTDNNHSQSMRQILMHLIKEEGFAAVMKGVKPRMFSMATNSTVMVIVYEKIKKLSSL